MTLDKSRPLESAIPKHLQTVRTQPLGLPEAFLPTTQSYSARFKPTVKILPMVFYEVQYRKASQQSVEAIDCIKMHLGLSDGPSFWDQAKYVDELGYTNVIFVGYWDSDKTFTSWNRQSPIDWWFSNVSLNGDVGLFRECYIPGIEDTETTFSHQHAEGYSCIADYMSGEVMEHGYWGSSRDRIPRSQTDSLKPSGLPSANIAPGSTSLGRHVVVEPHENLCLLRSGQDWGETSDMERKLYLDRVEPVLRIGMNFLRDEGNAIGCLFNRFMRIENDGGPADKTYSLSAWYGLEQTESWAKAKEHLAIFGAGANHYNTVGEKAKLRIYHEMSVVRARDQSFEYFNCHPKTGMLNAVRHL